MRAMADEPSNTLPGGPVRFPCGFPKQCANSRPDDEAEHRRVAALGRAVVAPIRKIVRHHGRVTFALYGKYKSASRAIDRGHDAASSLTATEVQYT